ncbi:hypothetical protein MTsPCn5_40490 [Croceitalea sp. MTPC5]|uniref:hypothetical protein n=1 Tax=Croceitalea sp. MTPC5 TaxID=3056565 RepID=UPI002B39A312|nr:hypothetical protein MTsPCn5_40490 [Croceitalea sp. MTPC5]
MIKILNIFAFLVLIHTTNGQQPNAEYLELKKILLESNTELIVEYHSDCIGSAFITLGEVGDCEYENPFYLFWIKEDKYYKRKFTNCGIFKVNEMAKSDFLESVKENLKLIEKSEILPVIHKSKKTLEGGVAEETIIETELSHYCESKFSFHTKSDKIEKSIIDYYLDTKMIDENTPNDNYELNEKSILNTIFKLIEKETE